MWSCMLRLKSKGLTGWGRALGASADQAERCLRPFARRLLSTSRPDFVAILSRNPCFRFLFTLLG